MSGAVRRGPLRMRDLLPQLKALGEGDDAEPCEGGEGGEGGEEREEPQTPGVTYKVGLRAATPRSVRGRSTPLRMRQTPAQRSAGKRPKVKYSLFTPEKTPSHVDAFAVPRSGFDASFERLDGKLSTPRSVSEANLSNNAILREHRADSDNRRPFPAKGGSFFKNNMHSISERENVHPVSVKNSSNSSPSDSKNHTEPSGREENRSQIHITRMDPSPPSEAIVAQSRPPVRVVDGGYFPHRPPQAPDAQCPPPPAREVRPVTKQYAQMPLKGKFYTVLGKCGSGGSSDVYKVLVPTMASLDAPTSCNVRILGDGPR